MNVLFINPPEYTFAGFHNVHTYPIDLYNWATIYKEAGHNVEVFDMYPELANSDSITNVGGDIYYDGIKTIDDLGIVRKCGNYENEQLVKGVLRTGIPNSILEQKLQQTNYDEIVVCAMGSKTGVTSASWIYVFMGVYETINICKEQQPDSKVILIGEYTKICPAVAGASLADIVALDPASTRHFTNTDISLFKGKNPSRINIATSYGCINQCAFCFIPLCERADRREKPVEDVLNYIESLVEAGHTKLRFLDANLLGNWDKHMKLILDGIISKGWSLDLTSYGGVEPSKLTNDIASKMSKAGFKTINVPLDNSDPSVLELWGNAKTIDAWDKATTIAKDNFETVSSYIMMGYPGQTYKNLTNSIKLCTDKDIIPALLPYTPIPGTIYEDKEKNPEDLHPLLFPYASQELKVSQIEDLLEAWSPWYKKSTIKPTDMVPMKRIYVSSPAIPTTQK